jgi:hypothetical protein
MLTEHEIKALRDLTAGQPEYCTRSLSEPKIAELCTRLLEAEAALGQVRTVLASTDIVSLPDDYSTVTMAHNRMDRIRELTLQGLAEIGRCEALEARVEVLEEALLGMNSHMERMQATASSYLEPGQGATDTEQSFINAMLYLLDGPEQREVQGKARAALQDQSQ